MRNLINVALLAAAGSIAASPAAAQAPQTARLLGKIERIDGQTLTIKTAEAEREVRLVPDTTLFALTKATLADVKPNAYLGVGAMPQPDGTQKAIRVFIFPESMRGLGEGHRPWDKPGTTMTNAAVDTTVAGIEGQVVTVKYNGGEKKILIAPGAAILTYLPGTREELKPGASVSVTGTMKTGALMEASRIVVGRDGLSP